MPEPRKIALFGGTFDPVHRGHVYMADVARFENNPIGFYEYEGKKMRDAAKKVVRKLHKLYGMAKEKESGDDRFLNLNKKISNKLK